MVFIIDLTMKNRRWDEDFDPKPPGLLRRMLGALAARIGAWRASRQRAESEHADEKSTAKPCGHAVQC
ncbi:hypothetical protein [Ensifer sp.]|uniref:hypothetical protein n=1 Tax=Ensifer sp. TaxID=1872086 RepID=UPI002E11C26F|nr:hypothetical protein [Ensifer sp.]